MPSLYFERRQLLHEGIRLSYDDGSGVAKPIAHINGNDISFRGPVILTSVDAHAVYGLSHPQVISTILKEGPQPLVSSKELAHTLFEHGMKAALGKQKIGNNVFVTNLETYYRVHQTLGEFLATNGGFSYRAPSGGAPTIFCTSGGSAPALESGQFLVELHRIQEYHKIDLP